jgi:hypothetical protein
MASKLMGVLFSHYVSPFMTKSNPIMYILYLEGDRNTMQWPFQFPTLGKSLVNLSRLPETIFKKPISEAIHLLLKLARQQSC